MVIVEASVFPSLAKEGWARPKEKCAKPPLKGADGVVVSSYRLPCRTVLIIGGLKQLPRLRQLRNGAVFLNGAATPPVPGRTVQIALHATAGTPTGRECAGFNGLPSVVLRVIIEEGRIPLLCEGGVDAT